MAPLSLLCVTRAEACVLPLLMELAEDAAALHAQLVIAADGDDAWSTVHEVFSEAHRAPAVSVVVPVHSAGYLESVLDEALDACTRDYVLRLDDDERLSDGMRLWLASGAYCAFDHWKFARAHLWGDREHALMIGPLWPDHQTRLSLRELAGHRRTIHAGSPYGGGQLAPVVIEHHKFLLKSREERRAIVRRYDLIRPGAGTAFLPFQVPEDAYPTLTAVPLSEVQG